MANEATALARAYDLTVWTAERVARFPRTHHYTIGQRMVETLLDVQALLIEAWTVLSQEPVERHCAAQQ